MLSQRSGREMKSGKTLPIQSQNLPKDQNQHHPHENPALLHVRPHSTVSHNSDRVAGRETREADGKAAGQVHATLEEGVGGGWRLHAAGDQDGDDEGVDGDDSGHDDGDEGLWLVG
jgi:hypothetical protein